MAIQPVTHVRMQIAEDFGLHNVDAIAASCRVADVPFFVACALFEKESMGKNVWGNDVDGFFRELPPEFEVTKSTFQVFEYYVMELGRKSNGVGPAQITWKGFFPDMEKQGLRPWWPYDNMRYGLGLLHLYKAKLGATWETAGTAYNGGKDYGRDFAKKVAEWHTRLDI